jgi:hypothetical protein
MVESSKTLPILLILVAMVGALGWTLVTSVGNFDMPGILSGRSFRGAVQGITSEGGSTAETETPTPTLSAAPIQQVDRYPVLRLSPHPKPLFAP